MMAQPESPQDARASEPTVGWPRDLVLQLTRGNAIVIIGAGVSAESVRRSGAKPPKWKNLLELVASALGLASSAGYKTLMAQGRFLDAASFLKSKAREASREQDFYATIRSAVEGELGDLFPGNAWHDAILRLAPDVVVTTNFDKIFERASAGGYEALEFTSDHVGREVRRGLPILLKIHGSVGHIENIVLTRQDFARVRSAGAHALDILSALLATRTALLLGYSLSDPDVQLLFENVLGGRAETPAHYMYTADSLEPYEREVLRDSFGVAPITFPSDRYDLAQLGLEELASLVESERSSGVTVL